MTRRFTLLLGVMISLAAQAQGSGRVVGTQCWINGKLVGGFPAGYTCPGTGGGTTGGGASPVDSALYNSFYQLGYQFGQWLVGSGSDRQTELQKQQMMAELRRRQAEAERQHREEEARRLAEMYNRLVASLKLSGLPNLQLKEIPPPGAGLKLKLGEGSGGQGIKGLPGIYLGDEKKPYGIPGLPGLYTGGPGEGSGLAGSKLRLKTGDQAGAPAAGTSEAAPALASETGLQLKSGAGAAVPPPTGTAFDPGKMTPQQLADVAEAVSRLTPEDQQRLLAGQQPATAPRLALKTSALPEQHADAARAASGASSPEEASAKARAGFDQPAPPPPVQLGKSGTTPSILRAPGIAVSRAPGAPPATTEPSARTENDWVKQYLFPGEKSSPVFPRSHNPPLTNPLREEQKLRADLKSWDDWAVERAAHVFDQPADQLYPAETERRLLNTAAIEQHAPDLLDRYNSDTAFKQRVDLRLQYATESVALNYYQDLANVHKAAILEYRAELEKLAASGKLDSRVSLEDQYRLNPERRKVVQAAWDRVSIREQAALAKVRENVGNKLDKEYQYVFRRIRNEEAPQN